MLCLLGTDLKINALWVGIVSEAEGSKTRPMGLPAAELQQLLHLLVSLAQHGPAQPPNPPPPLLTLNGASRGMSNLEMLVDILQDSQKGRGRKFDLKDSFFFFLLFFLVRCETGVYK